ncbi:hypothetical protein [Puerhibacterium sp. TATVAM-FAB25]|uniref:hypothetical protein n=1 Tax=Puerhibacterium sp. TATVAM-FAB25 TaxID=3093699 RepID=UPI00397BABA7
MTHHQPAKRAQRVTWRESADGYLEDHSWVKAYPRQLTALIQAPIAPTAIELALYLMTQLKTNSPTIENWNAGAAAHRLGRDPDTISAATSRLCDADFVRKRRRRGLHLDLNPALAFRGYEKNHREALEAMHIPAPPRPWIKVFTPNLHTLIQARLPGSELRVMLRLIALTEGGNSTQPLGPPTTAASAIGMTKSPWCAALKVLEEGELIQRANRSNTAGVTINPQYAFLGGPNQRAEAIATWRRTTTQRARAAKAAAAKAARDD